MQNFSGEKIIVYGLGKSGVSTAYALCADGAHVIVVDKTPYEKLKENPAVFNLVEKEGCVFVQTEQALAKGDAFFAGVKGLFKTPGMHWDDELLVQAQKAKVSILGDVDYFFAKNQNAKFIGITGTNGKSTTTALVGHILKNAGLSSAVGGNIGQAVMGLPNGLDYYVIELSSYQLELTHEIVFERAVILNLTPDHMERHGTMENYLDVKLNVFDRQGADAIQVMGVDDAILQTCLKEHKKASAFKHLVTISSWNQQGAVHIDTESFLVAEGVRICRMRDFLNIPGRHNWQNVAAAYALLEGIISREAFLDGLRSFKGLPHRMEQVFARKHLLCVNDSKATNPEASVHALDSFSNVYWILGGLPKEKGVVPCLDHLKNVQMAFTIGQCGEAFAEVLNTRVKTVYAKNMETAVRLAHDQIRKDSLPYARLLLSPACASWDQFDSFEHRGDVFASLCRDIFKDFE